MTSPIALHTLMNGLEDWIQLSEVVSIALHHHGIPEPQVQTCVPGRYP